jgi:lysyl-tRNA synthetase, class II
MSRINDTIEAKKEKRAQLEAVGINPHPYNFNKTHTVAEARERMGEVVRTAGRIMATRAHGKVIFLDCQDSTSNVQLMVRETEVGQEQFSWIKTLVDRGDFLGVEGEVITTQTGEVTILAKHCEFLGKALRPLPTEWNAAEDKEIRFRRRYIDMLINPDTKRVLDARWLIEREIRRYLQDNHAFTEVSTPVFQPLYGGTNAKPFTTYMNALDCTYYLRLAPELYLKRLIVGGYEKIFEIARNFRNEGIDQTHQPEFTMIEWYETYADYHRMMDVTEGLFKHLATQLYGETAVQVGEQKIEIGQPWPRKSMIDLVREYLQLDYDQMSDEDLRRELEQRQIAFTGVFSRGKALFSLFDKLIAPHLVEPTWVIDYPREVSPLAKKHRLNPEFAERFEAYIGGKEMADGWSEITDPIDQRQIFENEQKNMRAGDDEAHPLDEDFLEAMEYGMPPLGGIGIGIDRLVMFLTNTWSIREVIAFPTLRPLAGQQHKLSAAPTPKTSQPASSVKVARNIELPPREEVEKLLEEHVKSEALRRHCQMVAQAMAAYAQELDENEELWYQTGLLHDLDWEAFPDEHPNKALTEWLSDYPQELRDAVAAHAPDRTGKHPETTLERYLFACDELAGFMHAVSLMRPEGFQGMKPKSIKKKLKDRSFAANVSRSDIEEGLQLIGKEIDDHLNFMIEVYTTESADA